TPPSSCLLNSAIVLPLRENCFPDDSRGCILAPSRRRDDLGDPRSGTPDRDGCAGPEVSRFVRLGDPGSQDSGPGVEGHAGVIGRSSQAARHAPGARSGRPQSPGVLAMSPLLALSTAATVLLVILAALVLLVLFGIGTFNTLVSLRNRY